MKLRVEHQVNLKSYNTMAMNAIAQDFFVLSDEQQLLQLHEKNLLSLNTLVLGGGSNVLFTKNYQGLVIHNQLKGIEVIEEDVSSIIIKVAAGENWHEFVMFCVKHGYGGLENLSLIPGTVGAAPIQNIGAYGVEIKDHLLNVEAYELASAKKISFDKKACEFSYRDSIFKRTLKNKYLVSAVTFRLKKYPVLNFKYGALESEIKQIKHGKLSIKVISDAVIRIRQSKLPDPKILPNAGSFFKNPIIDEALFNSIQQKFKSIPHFVTEDKNKIKIPAGWLIEQSGFKGKRFGNVGCHEKQALVLINYNDAEPQELLSLIEEIQKVVIEKFNIELAPEVQII